MLGAKNIAITNAASASPLDTATPYAARGCEIHEACPGNPLMSPLSRGWGYPYHEASVGAGVLGAVGSSGQSAGRRAWFTSRATAQASATGPTCPSLSGLLTDRIAWMRPS